MCFLQRLDSKRTELGIAGYIYRILVSHPILVDSHIDTLQLAGYSRSSNVVVVAFVFLSTRMALWPVPWAYWVTTTVTNLNE